MPVTITHSTPADGTFSATGAAAWDATHTVSGLGTMAEQNANNVNITGGSITGVTGVLSSLTVNSTPTSGGAAGQIMFDTGTVLQESSNLTWDNTNNVLRLVGATKTGVTLTGVAITGTAGQFSCSAASVPLVVGQLITISGTFGGTGSITGYTNPTSYYISATNGSTTFTLTSITNAAIVTTAGTPTGLTYSYDPYPLQNLTQTWNSSTTAFSALKLNVTDTASNGFSFLADLQVNGTRRFGVYKSGSITTAGSLIFGNNNYVSVSNNTFIVSSNLVDVATISSAGLGLTSSGGVNFSSTADPNATKDLILTRRGAANLRFGAADAAAPVAQTLSVQSVVAGTSNTAGANLTITGSQGTGTGAGGSIIFQVAPAGSTGTAQNALSTALTIASDRTSTFAGGAIVTGANNYISFPTSGTGSNGSGLNIANYFGQLGLFNGATIGFQFQFGTGGGITVNNVGALYNISSDVYLGRKAAANWRLGAADAAAPVAQTLSVQSVVAGTSNTAGANLTITGSQGTGTGAGGSIIFQVAPAGSSGTAQNALGDALAITSAGQITATTRAAATRNFILNSSVTGNPSLEIRGATVPDFTGVGFQPNVTTTTTGVLSQGGSAAGGVSFLGFNASSDSVPPIGFYGHLSKTTGNAQPAISFNAFEWNGTTGRQVIGSTEFAAQFWNGTTTLLLSVTGGGLLQFAGTTSSFPALKRSTTILQVRLADDSAYAPVEASTVRTATAYTVATLPAAGTAGRKAYVTDALAPTFLGVLTGGGTVVCPVFDNGTAWVAG